MRLTTKIISGAVGATMLLGAPAAFAQTSAQQGYSTPGGVVQTQVGNSPTTPSASHQSQPTTSTQQSSPSTSAAAPVASAKTSGNKLPFTGLDIALVVAAGGILLAMGLGIRRLSRSAEVA